MAAESRSMSRNMSEYEPINPLETISNKPTNIIHVPLAIVCIGINDDVSTWLYHMVLIELP